MSDIFGIVLGEIGKQVGESLSRVKTKEYNDTKNEYNELIYKRNKKISKYNDSLSQINNRITGLNEKRIKAFIRIQGKMQRINSHISLKDREFIQETLRNSSIPKKIISSVYQDNSKNLKIAEKTMVSHSKAVAKASDEGIKLMAGDNGLDYFAGAGIIALSAVSNYFSIQENIGKLKGTMYEIEEQIAQVRKENKKLEAIDFRLTEIERSFNKAIKAFNFAHKKVYSVIFPDELSKQKIKEKRKRELKTFSAEEREYLRQLCLATESVVKILGAVVGKQKGKNQQKEIIEKQASAKKKITSKPVITRVNCDGCHHENKYNNKCNYYGLNIFEATKLNCGFKLNNEKQTSAVTPPKTSGGCDSCRYINKSLGKCTYYGTDIFTAAKFNCGYK